MSRMAMVLQPERRRSARILALEERERLEKEKKKASMEEANFNSNENINVNRRGKCKATKHKSLGELFSTTQGIQPPETQYYPSKNGKGVYSMPVMPEKHVLVFVLDLLQREFQCILMAQYINHPEEVEACYQIKTLGFRTMRAKLREGAYTVLDHFESDVYTLCESCSPTTKNPHNIEMYFQGSLTEYAWRLFFSLRTDPEKFKMEYGLISKDRYVKTDDAAYLGRHNYSQPAGHGSYGKNQSISANERRNSYQPFSNWNSRLTQDFIAPKTLVTINNDVGYRDILLRYVEDMGPIPKQIAEKKIAQLEEALAEAAAYGWQLQTSLPETSYVVSEKKGATTFRSSVLEDVEKVSRIVRGGRTENYDGAKLEKPAAAVAADQEQRGCMDLESYLKGKGIGTVDNGDGNLTLNNLKDDIQLQQEPISDLLAATLQWNPRNWMNYPTSNKPKPMETYTSGMEDMEVYPSMVISERESKQEEGQSSYGLARPFWLPSQPEGSTQVPGHSLMAAKPEGYRAEGHSSFPIQVDQDLRGLYPLNEAEGSMSLVRNGQYPAMPSLDSNYCQNTASDHCSCPFGGSPTEIDIWGQNMFPQQEVRVASTDMAMTRAPGLSDPTAEWQVANDQYRLWEREFLPTPMMADHEQPNLALQL